jgi:hypothetical protein
MSFGATEGQGQRCYAHIEEWCYEIDKETGRRTDIVKDFIRGKPLQSHTVWKTGSKVEVVAGSENAVSGPHPAKAHADEIDMMEEAVWNQSRGMAVSLPAKGQLPSFMEQFRGVIPPQDIATSTRNSLKGRMQTLLDEVAADLKAGDIPLFEVYRWCIWETAAEVANCQCAPLRERRKRCKELGLDPKETCQCHRVAKGRWGNEAPTPELVGEPRRLNHVCAVYEDGKVVDGKAFRGRGWKPYIDVRQTFKRNTPGTWVLQHECREGKDENAYIPGWSLPQYGIRNYVPHRLYGPIYQGVDWGTGHPACVLWFQYLTSEVPGIDFNYQPIWLAAGTYVCFREIYVAGIDSATLAKRVVQVEDAYKRDKEVGGQAWRVNGRFCDPAGKGDRLIFVNHGMKSDWPVKTRDKGRLIEVVQNLVVDDRFAVDIDACEMFCEEVEVWQKNPKTGKELDRYNHAMAAWRYGIANAEVIEQDKTRKRVTAGGVQQGMPSANRRERRAMTVSAGRRAMEDGQERHGEVAFSGGTQVHLDPQFTLR